MQPDDITIQMPQDVRKAGESAKAFANLVGFPSAESEAICLVVTELGSNLLRHATQGTITLSRITANTLPGIEIVSDDRGPGIRDIERAMADGYSTAGGLGTGLGTINRLMDEVEFHNKQPAGLRIVCRRWLRPVERSRFENRLTFGAATRPFRNSPENGDAFVIKQWGGHALVGVIDGLGHGQFAQRASQTARYYIEQHFDQPLLSLFRGAGRACHGTRGVVMALARFDLAKQQLEVANVGNIEIRLIGGPKKRFNPIVRRGIIGMNAPNPVCTQHDWEDSNILIMHSDGLRTHWEWSDFDELEHDTPSGVARRLLQALSKTDDDATILVARSSH